jgi:uncharacterized membrane protein YphA (DoxX/SURF4 family)
MEDMLIALRVALALWLGIAGLFKLSDWRSFRRVVRHYRVLSSRHSDLYAATVPIIELISAIMLCLGIAVGLGGLLASMLLISFMIGVSVNIRRGRDLECHCLGNWIRTRAGWNTLVVDLLLLIPALVLSAYAFNHDSTAAINPIFKLPVVSIILGIGYALIVGVFYSYDLVRGLLDHSPMNIIGSLDKSRRQP